MKSLKYIILFVLITIIGCNKDKKANTSEKINQLDTVKEVNTNVMIYGVTDIPIDLRYISIMDNSYFFGKPYIDLEKSMMTDTIQIKMKSISSPQIMRFLIPTENHFYDTHIFVEPGDTLRFEIKNKKITFYGKKASYNNFYSAIKSSTPLYRENAYKGDINEYKKNLKSIYNLKIKFLNDYFDSHNINSTYFINYVEEDFKQKYFNELINPRNLKVKNKNIFYGELDGFKSILSKEFSEREIIFDYSDYFNGISLENFKKSEFLINNNFKQNINLYIRNVFISSGFSDYSKEKLLEEKEFIENNFEGDIELYAITRLILDYHTKGFGNSAIETEIMKNLIEEYENKVVKPSYIDYLNKVKLELDSHSFELPTVALETKLINHLGDTITLKDIFARSNKRIKVVDFWASWCPPCITQIEYDIAFKDRLQVENNVEWIHLSIDQDYDQWLKKSKELAAFLNFNNSYYIEGGKNSPLGKSLRVHAIPRFVIFDKTNKIVLNSAPRPSDKAIFEKVIDDVYNK